MKFSVSSLIAVICFFTAVAAITDEQEAAIARLKLLMEKLSSIKRSPVFAEEKRGISLISASYAVYLMNNLAADTENDMKARELSNYMQFLDNMRY